ncbi:MAG: 30S ribosome-binding factor RbfA [Planctomycetota bacterium]
MPSYRPAKMASLVREVVGEAIAHELNDPRISPMASVTRVLISGDLQVAKVYVSVLGSEEESRRTLTGLTHATGHIQRLLSKRLQVRHCPEIRFFSDLSVKGSMRTVQLIEESVKADRARHPTNGQTQTSPTDERPDGASA